MNVPPSSIVRCDEPHEQVVTPRTEALESAAAHIHCYRIYTCAVRNTALTSWCGMRTTISSSVGRCASVCSCGRRTSLGPMGQRKRGPPPSRGCPWGGPRAAVFGGAQQQEEDLVALPHGTDCAGGFEVRHVLELRRPDRAGQEAKAQHIPSLHPTAPRYSPGRTAVRALGGGLLGSVMARRTDATQGSRLETGSESARRNGHLRL